MDFSELLIKRRSVRAFKEEDVPLETVKEIIRDSILAPSSGNGQPWRFIVIDNGDLIKRISDESKANILSIIEKDPDTFLKKYEGVLKNKNFNVFYNAPCLVIIIGPRQLASTYVDCTLVASYFMMSAASRGFGTCWVNLGSNIRDPKLLEEIGIPADYVIVAPIIIGRPAVIPAPSSRNEDVIIKIVS